MSEDSVITKDPKPANENKSTKEFVVELQVPEKKRVTKVSLTSELPMVGGNEKKERWRVGAGNRDDLKLVYKEIFYEHKYNNSLPKLIGFEDELEGRDPAEIVAFAWKYLKDHGLPVVPTLRVVKGKQAVVMTDLEADGSVLYDNKIDSGEQIPLTQRPEKQTDQAFINIKFDEVEEKAIELSQLATKANLRLASDGEFHLRVNPNGDWDLIILDLARISICKNPNERDQEIIQRVNLKNSKEWVEKMKNISEKLHQINPNLKAKQET